MIKHKPRLKDIAARTGYGTNTVSLALRGSTRISLAAREAIREAAEALDYVPNHIAKTLVSRRSRTVGLILPEITNPILTSAAQEIQLTLAAQGYGVLFATSNGDLEEEKRAIELVRSRMVDGLLIYPTLHARLDHLQRLRDRGFPVVMLVGVAGSGLDAVGIDERAGAFDATRHLIDAGHRRIGLLVTPHGAHEKREGFLAALAEAGLPADAANPAILGGAPHHSIEGGIAAMASLMAASGASGGPPTAVFATSDVLALGALRWAGIHGRRVPGDVALVGFDDIEAARHAVTPISTINNDVGEIARRSVARLLLLIDAAVGSGDADGAGEGRGDGKADGRAGGALPPATTDLLRGHLIVRDSTRPPA